MKSRVFQETLWLICRAGANALIPYLCGYLILMQTSSLHRKTAIFSGVKYSFGQKTQVIVKSRVFQEAPWFICRAGVKSSTPYLGGYLILIANIKIPPKITIFYRVEYSSGHKTQEIVKSRVFQEALLPHITPSINYYLLDFI